MSSNNVQTPEFKKSLPRALGFRKHYHQAIDFLRGLTAHKTGDRQGLSSYEMRPPLSFRTQLEQKNQAVVLDRFDAQ